jgi:hypothetical protein
MDINISGADNRQQAIYISKSEPSTFRKKDTKQIQKDSIQNKQSA